LGDKSQPVRIFIGSGEASLLERKVLIQSIRKNTKRPLDIWVINGTHNAIERNDDTPFLAPLSLTLKYQNATEFSLYRYLIPELVCHEGRAIYMDSDMICTGDIGELFDTPMDDFDFLAVPEYGQSQWATSVMLINCEKCRFDLTGIFADIDTGLYTYTDFSRFNHTFITNRSYSIGKLDPHWNEFDHHDAKTKLIHYTNLLTQPWKFPDHPFGELWFQYFREAKAEGFVTEKDISLSLSRAYVRQNINSGNSPFGLGGRLIRKVTRWIA
jgi:lipopolysaccharide biosynthesis glycosyltransferase